MTFDTKPLLKGFGALTDVAGQIATDKAVNSRRRRSSFVQFDITQGQLIENVTVPADGKVAHKLGRVAKGCQVLLSNQPGAYCAAVSASDVTIDPVGATVTMWVV